MNTHTEIYLQFFNSKTTVYRPYYRIWNYAYVEIFDFFKIGLLKQLLALVATNSKRLGINKQNNYTLISK